MIQFKATNYNYCHFKMPSKKRKNRQDEPATKKKTKVTDEIQGQFFCDKCETEPFIYRENLLAHLESHKTKLTPYRCTETEQCKNLIFETLFEKREHEIVHNPGQFACNVCPRTFHANYLLLKHQMYHRPKKGSRNFACDLCIKFFNAPESLESHKQLVH